MVHIHNSSNNFWCPLKHLQRCYIVMIIIINITGGQADYPIPHVYLPGIPHLHVNRPFTPCGKSQPEWTFKNVAIDESNWLFLTLTKIQINKLVLNFSRRISTAALFHFVAAVEEHEILKIPKIHNETETETPSLTLGICEFHQSYF